MRVLLGIIFFFTFIGTLTSQALTGGIKLVAFQESDFVEESNYEKDLESKKQTFRDSMISQLRQELPDSINIDSLVDTHLAFTNYFNTTSSTIKYQVMKYLVGHVVWYTSIDSMHNIHGDYKLLTKGQEHHQYLAKLDSTTTYGKFQYGLSQLNIVEFIEEKSVTKNINGFDCFRVIYKIEDTFDNLTDRIELIMYVTEEIASKYHPVVHIPQILDKYYPLDIIYKTSLGRNKQFTLSILERY